MSPYSIKIMIQRLKHRAGVTSSGGAHRFRVYFITRCGMDLNSLRLLLGLGPRVDKSIQKYIAGNSGK